MAGYFPPKKQNLTPVKIVRTAVFMSTKGGKSTGKTAEKLQQLGYEGATTALQGKTLVDPKAKSVDVSFATTPSIVPSSAVMSADVLFTTTPAKFKDVSMTLMPREDDMTRPIELENKAMMSKKMDDVPIDTSTAIRTAEDEKLAAYQRKMAAYEKDKELRQKGEIQKADFLERDTQARKEQKELEDRREAEKESSGPFGNVVFLLAAAVAVAAAAFYFLSPMAKEVMPEPAAEKEE